MLHTYLLLRQQVVSAMLQAPQGKKGLDRFVSAYANGGWHKVDSEGKVQKGIQQAYRTGGVRWLEGKVTPEKLPSQHLEALLPRPDFQSRLKRLTHQESTCQHASPTSLRLQRLLQEDPREERPAIRLTFHFGRKNDEKYPNSDGFLPRVPIVTLRREALEQAVGLLEEARLACYAPLVVGLDVAGLETSTPTEVFAPLLRALREPWQIPPSVVPGQRRHSPHHFGLSIHAGEEFRHLAEGLRRIDETLRFCSLRAGDRLGHALALGIEPEAWARRSEPGCQSKPVRAEPRR